MILVTLTMALLIHALSHRHSVQIYGISMMIVRYDSTMAAPFNGVVTLYKKIPRSVESAIFRMQKRYNIGHFPSMRDKK